MSAPRAAPRRRARRRGIRARSYVKRGEHFIREARHAPIHNSRTAKDRGVQAWPAASSRSPARALVCSARTAAQACSARRSGNPATAARPAGTVSALPSETVHPAWSARADDAAAPTPRRVHRRPRRGRPPLHAALRRRLDRPVVARRARGHDRAATPCCSRPGLVGIVRDRRRAAADDRRRIETVALLSGDGLGRENARGPLRRRDRACAGPLADYLAPAPGGSLRCRRTTAPGSARRGGCLHAQRATSRRSRPQRARAAAGSPPERQGRRAAIPEFSTRSTAGG